MARSRMIRIYGVVYGDKTTEYIPFRNDAPAKAWRFENNAMIEISDNHLNDISNDDFVGVFSWKFPKKTCLSPTQVYERILHMNADVGHFCDQFRHLHFMNWSDEGHKGIRDFIIRCCEHVGIEYNDNPEHIIYANQFVARKWVYQKYINEVIKACLEILEGPMWEEVNRDAGYTRAMDSAKLKELTGLEFYNYIPFIAERMMMQFVSHYNIKTVNLT